MFRQDSRTRYYVLQWVALKRAQGYWLRIGSGYRGADGTIDAICEPLPIGPHLRLVELATADADELTPLFGWTGGDTYDPPLRNSGCRSTRPRRIPRFARMEHAQ